LHAGDSARFIGPFNLLQLACVAEANLIGSDIRSQRAAFNMLEGATSPPAVLSHIRLLDIVAWTSKGVMPSDAAKR